MLVSMTAGARTPEELESLLEDAFLLRDSGALTQLFEEHAVLAVADMLEARRVAQIGRSAMSLWDRGLTYVAEPLRVLQAREIALVLARRGVAVARRGVDGVWRYLIAVPSLDVAEVNEPDTGSPVERTGKWNSSRS
jgi:hypothetical protein